MKPGSPVDSAAVALARSRDLQPAPWPTTCQRYEWCRKPLGATWYSFGDGLGNVYRKCDGGHWTPEPPPPDLAAIEACDEDD